MICARCDRLIEPGQEYDTLIIEQGSGPGPTIRLHVQCRRAAATQPLRYPRR